GLHDLKRSKTAGTHQVELADYRRNLQQMVERLRKDTGATIVFANTTPIHDDRHANRKAGFDRTEADVVRYNAAAVEVMLPAGVPVHDLHALVERGGVETLQLADGTHYTAAGYELLADAVAD